MTPPTPMTKCVRAIATRRWFLTASAFGISLAASIALAQTPFGPMLPPLPVPPMPFPTVTMNDTAQPSTALPPPTLPRAPPPGKIGSIAGSDSFAARKAWERSGRHEVWYGWQTLAFDAGAIALLSLGPTFGGALPPFAASSGAYGLGPPAIHFSHGAVAKGFGSLALRVALPFLGFRLGYLVGQSFHWSSRGQIEASTVGAMAGGAGAMALDAAMLGWERWHGPEKADQVVAFAARMPF